MLTAPIKGALSVEIKFGASAQRADLHSLNFFIEKDACEYGLLVNNSDSVRLVADRILQIPAGCL